MGMPTEHVEGVCKMGQGAECCAFLMVGSDGLECAKVPGNEGFRQQIEVRRPTMTAQGDNCDGWTDGD